MFLFPTKTIETLKKISDTQSFCKLKKKILVLQLNFYPLIFLVFSFFETLAYPNFLQKFPLLPPSDPEGVVYSYPYEPLMGKERKH